MIIRIDDWPSGIRPILQDHIKELSPILYEFEKKGLYYHLGIVPMICSDEDWKFLNSLSHMIPVCHGYDHLYPKYSPILAEKDPYNKGGLAGSENEFEGLSPEETDSKISTALETIRSKVSRIVDTFIAPFNKINDYVEESLIKNGIKIILGENIVTKILPVKSSMPFYLKSNQINGMDLSKAECITLHVTWEWDLIQSGESKLSKLCRIIKEIQDNQ